MIHHQFQPSVNATKDDALRPPKDFRFGNFQGIQTLPSVGRGHVAGQHVKSYFNNKQIFYTICEWFDTWMPWQKRIVLCGTTDRCSNQLLESLTTVLEPVFHRDFATALRGHYPRAPLKRVKSQEASHKELMKALVMATEGTDLDPNKKSSKRSKKFKEIKDVQGFARTYVKDVLEGAVKEITAENKSKLSSWDELDENHNLCSPVERQFKVKFSEANFLKFIDDSDGDTPEPRDSGYRDSGYQEDDVDTDNRYTDLRTSPESRLRNIISKQSSTSSLDRVLSTTLSSKLDSKLNLDDNSRPRTPRFGLYEESTPESSQCMPKTLTEQRVRGFVATPTQSRLSPSTLSWCKRRQRSASLPSTPSSGNSTQQSHHHQSNASSVDVASPSEFFEKQRVSRLGSMHGALRTGRIKKPKQVQDLYIPLQKSFKNAKWWNANKTQAARNKTSVKPAKENLKEHFKEQVKQIWQWLTEWEDHEKGDLLTELIKLCDQKLIQFFAQCLLQRLDDRSGINSLPDKLLFYIFTFLSTDDIGIAEKVCRRWYYIGAQEELWRIKCEELGRKEHIPNLVDIVEEFMKDKAVDWREAYGELSRIVLNARFIDKGRRHGWLSGPARNCHLLNLNFDDLLKRTPLPIESIQHIPIDSDSSSEESLDYIHRKMSTVVDLPIHFMQTVNDNDNDDDSQMSSRNTTADGVTPDAQGYRRNSQQQSRNDGTKSELASQDGKQSRQQKAPKASKKLQKKKHASEDFALDIRPDPIQAKDVLEKTMKKAEHDDLEEPPSQRQVVVNPVKRVRRLQGHLDAVFCLMFDSRRIVTGSMDRSIRVWDIRSGRSIRKIYGHKGGIRCIQFDEDKIISGSWDTTIMVWDIIHFDCLAVLSGHSDVVSCLQFNRKYLVTGSYDKTIRVWSMSGGYQCVRIIECHSEEVTCLMLDGVHVTSGSADTSIKVTNIETGECIMHITGIIEPVTSLALQGELILSGTLAGKLYFWNRVTGEVEAGVQPHDTPIFNITFMPASHGGAKFLTAAGDGTIKEWDLYSMTCVRALHGHRGPVRDVQATADRVVSCSDDGNVRIWDLYTPTVQAGTKAAEDTIDTTTIKAKKD